MTSSFRELIPDTFAEPKEANTWRIEPFDRGFVVDLGGPGRLVKPYVFMHGYAFPMIA